MYNLKDKEDVKDYLTNLGIEYRFGCFSEKNPEICHLLGDFLEAVDKNYKKAGNVYKTNCDDRRYAKSCYKFGSYALLGRGLPQRDPLEAYRYFEKGCELGSPEACFHQALILTDNEKRTKTEFHKGMQLLEKACNGNNANGCYFLSARYITGVREKDKQEYKVPKNMEKAFQFAIKGCELGHIYCCANVSQMYTKGQGVEKNDELAKKYKQTTLNLQDEIISQKTLEFGEGSKN